jgi:hypothetical protein
VLAITMFLIFFVSKADAVVLPTQSKLRFDFIVSNNFRPQNKNSHQI